MTDTQSVDSSTDQTKKSKRKRIVTLRINRDLLMVIIAAVLILVAYLVGVQNGEDKSKKSAKAGLSDISRQSSEALSNRWTSVGTVQEVSDATIKVKDSRGETKDAKITKDTNIVDRKGTKLAAKDIKKNQRVIVSGTKDDKNNLTATRIRIQQ